MQVSPDWCGMYSPKQAEEQLEGFNFRGPGLYLTQTDTVLVSKMPHEKDPWTGKSDTGLYYFCVYNCPFDQTLFAWMRGCPVYQTGEEVGSLFIHWQKA